MIVSTKLCHQRKILKLNISLKLTEKINIFDGEVDQSERNFCFVTMPSFISLFSENSAKPLYFVKLISKAVTEMNISDPYGHFFAKGASYF